MKSKMLSLISIMVLTVESFFPNSAMAQAETNSIIKKTESVYVNVDSYGKITDVNIYNYYDLANVDSISEYGDYESVQVITGDNKAQISGDKLIWQTSGDKRLGYIGKVVDKEKIQIPWNISIKYYLNGVETLASELPHKSGLVKVLIHVIPNENAPEVYKNNYMMQISGSYDLSKYISVNSDDAIESIVGNTKTLTFMVLPGYDKEISIELGTEDFSMESITFAMIPLEGDLLELVQDIVEDKNNLREAWDTTNASLDVILNQLSNSSKSIDKMVQSSNDLKSGLNKINENGAERINIINDFKNQLEIVSGDFTSIDIKIDELLQENNYLKTRISESNTFINNIKNDLKNLNSNLNKNLKDLERLEKRAKEVDDDLENIETLIKDLATSINSLNKLLGNLDETEDIDINTLKKSLYSIKNSTEEIATEAGARLQEGGEDAEFYMEVIGAAKDIGSSLSKVSNELGKAEELMDDASFNTNNLTKNLKSVQKDLNTISKDIDNLETYSKDLPEDVSNLSKTTKAVTILIDELIVDIEKNSGEDKNKLIEFVDKTEAVIREVQKLEKDAKALHTTTQNTLSLLEKDLNITQNQVHSSTTGVIDGTQNLLKDLKGVTNQSSNLKKAKNQIYDIVTTDIDDIENKTTIFKINPDDKPISYASEKNECPEKVQIFVQSASIKEVEKDDIVDLEPKKEEMTFWEKLVAIFEKIKEFFLNLFKNK